MELYHYRSIKSAISEISNSSFKFSGVSELNDPLEGYVDIYWQGDEPAWEGLFRNYICGLYMSVNIYRLAGDENQIAKSAVPVDIHAWDRLPIAENLMRVSDEFLTDSLVLALISLLSAQNIAVSKGHLNSLLTIVHLNAFNICMANMQHNGLIGLDEYTLERPAQCTKTFADVVNLASKQPEKSDKFFEAIEAISGTIRDCVNSMLLKYAGDPQRSKWSRIQLDFPTIYVNQAPKILYPNGFIVCFSTAPDSSVMWGNYADSHKGVCLIYETGEKKTLSIESGAVIKTNGVSLKYRDETLHEVNYHEDRVKRNFFTSLGRLCMPQIHSWLVSADGKASQLLFEYVKDSWRDSYWEDNFKVYHTKLPEWEYEREYRLFITDTFYDYNRGEKDYVFLKFAPEQLKGVIWGINTTLSDKAKIYSAIESAGRKPNTLDFYQSQYNTESNEIVVRRVNQF